MMYKPQRQYQIRRASCAQGPAFLVIPAYGRTGIGQIQDERQDVLFAFGFYLPIIEFHTRGIDIPGNDMHLFAAAYPAKTSGLRAQVPDSFGLNPIYPVVYQILFLSHGLIRVIVIILIIIKPFRVAWWPFEPGD